MERNKDRKCFLIIISIFFLFSYIITYISFSFFFEYKKRKSMFWREKKRYESIIVFAQIVLL